MPWLQRWRLSLYATACIASLLAESGSKFLLPRIFGRGDGAHDKEANHAKLELQHAREMARIKSNAGNE